MLQSVCQKLVVLIVLVCAVPACSDGRVGDLNSGGIEPPPGFLTRTDANCRVAATKAADIGELSDTAPTIRQLNGQSLFGYATPDGRRVQCVVRHADESVSDIRVLSTE